LRGEHLLDPRRRHGTDGPDWTVGKVGEAVRDTRQHDQALTCLELDAFVFQFDQLSLAGRDFMAMDSGREHYFAFTPAMSLFVDCSASRRARRAALEARRGGLEFMQLAQYPFSPRFGWVQDRFGVSWQLNLVAG
jgi:predicted 3-demethylubiquinone-9 3-methyltransferase (glyoxalase superfamily)